jgi:hypothetical protein
MTRGAVPEGKRHKKASTTDIEKRKAKRAAWKRSGHKPEGTKGASKQTQVSLGHMKTKGTSEGEGRVERREGREI